MGEAKPSQHAGFVEICVAVCRPEFMARSSQLYYFMVSPECQRPDWVQATANHMAIFAEHCFYLTHLRSPLNPMRTGWEQSLDVPKRQGVSRLDSSFFVALAGRVHSLA